MKTRKIAVLAVAVACVLCLCAADGLAAVDVTVDGSQTYQDIKGFGTCFGYWINEPYSWDSFRQMYAQDLGASIVRMELGHWVLFQSGSLCYEGHCGHNRSQTDLFTDYNFTENINDNVALLDPCAQFVGTPFGVLVNAVDQYKLDDLMVVGSFWTPPHYVKTSGGPDSTYIKAKKGKSSLSGHVINDPYYHTQLGRYVCAWVKAWNDYWGVPLSAVSLQNEPYFDVGYNCCLYYSSYGPTYGGPPVDEFTGPIKAVGAERAANNLTFKLQAPEGILYDNGWADGLDRTFGWIQDIRNDPDAYAAVDGWVIHGYHPRARESSRSQRQRYQWDRYYNGVFGEGDVLPNYWDGIVTDTDKTGWNFQTEDGSQQSAWTGFDEYYGHNGAIGMSTQIHEAMVIAHQNAWIYWQTADSTSGEASEHCLTTGIDTTQPKYKAFKHFSRYIRPGSVLVDASPDMVAGVTEAVLTSAYVKDSTQEVVIVVINCDSASHTVNLTLNGLPPVQAFAAYRSTETDNHLSVGPYAVSGGVVSFTAPAESIVTLVGGGDTTPPAAPTNLTATAVSAGQIDLDWDDNTEPDLDSYNVYRDGSPIAAGLTDSQYSDTGLSPSTQYCYTVTAVDAASNESDESNQACDTTLAGGGTMHVDSITVTIVPVSGPRSKAVAEVVIKDNVGTVVADATVTGTFTGDISDSGSDDTDANGLAVIESKAANNVTSVTFCVDSVTHATLTYEPDDNVETCDSN
jgi:O-glycosyl hydrolase